MNTKEQLYQETIELTKSLISGGGLNKGYGTCDVEETLKTTYEALVKFNEYLDNLPENPE